MIRVLVALLASAAILAAPATAEARGAARDSRDLVTPRATTGPTPFTGRAWPGSTIRVYDSTPASYREGINLALRMWNESRVGITFVRTTSRANAHVVIKTGYLLGLVNGYATVGAARGAAVTLDTALVAVRRDGMNVSLGGFPEQIAITTAHELGHVLGLHHTRGCSLMTSNGSLAACRLGTPPEGSWTCRLAQPRDLAALTRRYGGPGRLRAAKFCRHSATASGRVGTITAKASTRALPVSLTWPATTNTYAYLLSRSARDGACPGSPAEGTVKLVLDNWQRPEYQAYWDSGTPGVAGRYCFAIWTRNGRGTLTGPSRAFVDVRPPTIAPVTTFSATWNGDTRNVDLAWVMPSGTTEIRIYREPASAICPTPTTFPVANLGSTASTFQDPDAPPGTWTYVINRSDDPRDEFSPSEAPGFASAPTCATVTIPVDS